MRVLLAVDGSQYSEAALEDVAARVWPANSEIRVVTAYELPLAPTPELWALPPDYFEALERAVSEHAGAVKEAALLKLTKALDPAIKITGDILQGAPRSAILEEADRWQADLIVVGSHGYGAWHRLLLGSVSQAIVSHAKCSVQVVRRADLCGSKEVQAA
jgi:nucleotide-binding universal stress UspA family protein